MSDKPRDDFDDDLEDDFEDDLDVEEAPAPAGRGRTGPGRGAATPAKGSRTARADAGAPGEAPIHITDNASKWFVIGTVLLFVLILLNGMLLGVGGFLTPVATPTPVVTAAPSAAPSAAASPAASK